MIEAYEQHKAAGVGVFAGDGSIDHPPVAERARALVAKAEALATRAQ